jgi:hypothetical protein
MALPGTTFLKSLPLMIPQKKGLCKTSTIQFSTAKCCMMSAPYNMNKMNTYKVCCLLQSHSPRT